jgi:hypothetical protein
MKLFVYTSRYIRYPVEAYRFFDIGTDHYYTTITENERLISDIAER